MSAISFRQASVKDAFPIMELYQRSQPRLTQDPLFLQYARLKKALHDHASLWVLAEKDGILLASISLGIDLDQRMGRLYRVLVDAYTEQAHELVRDLLEFTLYYTKDKFPELDLVYTTTLSFTPEQQEITSECGFKMLGIFPNASSEDKSGLNGLTAYFFEGVLESKRMSDISLHPDLEGLFEVTRGECGLPRLPLRDTEDKPNLPYEPLPTLERIDAPAFVLQRFQKLKEARTLDTFYPFQTPSVMLTDPEENIEVFARVNPENRFASIIGEHVRASVDPVALYKTVADQLRAAGATYLEVINDAADTEGNDAFLRAGFTPCAYFPALKRHGEKRRDFVVFGKSFEYLCTPDPDTDPVYLAYFNAYAQIEFRRYGLLGL